MNDLVNKHRNKPKEQNRTEQICLFGVLYKYKGKDKDKDIITVSTSPPPPPQKKKNIIVLPYLGI